MSHLVRDDGLEFRRGHQLDQRGVHHNHRFSSGYRQSVSIRLRALPNVELRRGYVEHLRGVQHELVDVRELLRPHEHGRADLLEHQHLFRDWRDERFGDAAQPWDGAEELGVLLVERVPEVPGADGFAPWLVRPG